VWLGAALLLVAVLVVTWRRQAPERIPPPRLFTATPPAGDFLAIPPDTLPIAWAAWDASTFARRDRPFVILLDAAWSETCALYAAALAAHAGARAALEHDVIAVRVDIDRRPDVHARFHLELDEVPSLLFLDPERNVWDLTPMLAPDDLARTIGELKYPARPPRRDPGLDLLRAMQPQPLGSGVAPPALDTLLVRTLDDLTRALPARTVDIEADSPLLESDALGFLREHAERTGSSTSRALFLQTLRLLLDSPAVEPRTGAIVQEVEAPAGRVSRARFLETNARFLLDLSTAARWTSDPVFVEAAARTARWLIDTLYDADVQLFRFAQGTLAVDASGWPLLRDAERIQMAGHDSNLPAPSVVGVYATSGNARAAVAFLSMSAREDVPIRPRAILDRLAGPVGAARVPHDLVRSRDDSLLASAHTFLGSSAELGLALLALHEATRSAAHLRRAHAIARTLVADFWDPTVQAFADVPTGAEDAAQPVRMRVRLYPPVENARALLFLYQVAAAADEPHLAGVADAGLVTFLAQSHTWNAWTASEFARVKLYARTPTRPN
jgi:hypothetical protein